MVIIKFEVVEVEGKNFVILKPAPVEDPGESQNAKGAEK